jgi:hypothetical protein
MTANSVTTQDTATNAIQQAMEGLSFSHQGAAGSTSLNFGEAAATHQDAQSSSTATNLSDAALGGSSGSSSSGASPSTTSGGASSGQNTFLTNDHATSYTQTVEKMLTFDHQGAAGSTSLSFGEVGQTHYDSQASNTSATIDDGLFGGNWGTGSAGGTGSSSQGSSGGSGGSNFFTTSDNNINFDSQMMKAFDFTHDGAAGSTSIGFETGSSTQWDSQSSSTSAMFDDLFGQSLWSNDASQSLLS